MPAFSTPSLSATRLTLAEIASDLDIPLSSWSNDCALIAQAIARRYQLDVRLWQLGNDGGDQQYHVMLIAPDGRVLDALECQARQGRDPAACADWYPFVGSKAEWGQGRGFDAEAGTEVGLALLQPRWRPRHEFAR